MWCVTLIQEQTLLLVFSDIYFKILFSLSCDSTCDSIYVEMMGFGKVVRQTLLEFGEQTSIAGIGLVISKKSYFKKMYWSILFVVMLFLTFNGLIETIMSFYDREVTTSIDLDYVPSVIFPAVSICNLNKYENLL